MNVIAARPTDEMYATGLEIDCQCARCGSSVHAEHCDQCEDGYDGHDCGEDCCACLYPEDNVECQYCDGTGVWRTCLSSPEWCAANPLPGRESVERGTLEWYTIGRGEEGSGT
ncbi:MAG: hypothetical protein AB7G11_02320 [Phycisphaerales bacterium]